MPQDTFLQQTLHFMQTPITVDIYYHASKHRNIIVLPALGVAIQKYTTLIQQLRLAGYNLIVADYPGCGRNQPRVSATFDYGYADLLGYFIPQLIRISQDLNDSTPIILGHSLGGHLATLYAQNHPVDVIGIATGNIGLKYWDFKGKLNILKAASVINMMIHKDGYLAGYKIGFGDREAKTLMRDWSKVIFTNRYAHIQQAGMSSHKALFIHMQQDDFAPLSSMRGLCQYFQCPEIQSLDLTAQLKGNQHSAWIKQPQAVVQLIQKSFT